MSKDPRKQRHQPPGPSHWLLLLKAVIGIGQVVSFVKAIFHD